MQDTEINVTKRERVATLRQVITPSSQEEVASVLAGIIELYREQKITGKMQIVFNQGGVQNFVTEEVTRPRSVTETMVFDDFFKNKVAQI